MLLLLPPFKEIMGKPGEKKNNQPTLMKAAIEKIPD